MDENLHHPQAIGKFVQQNFQYTPQHEYVLDNWAAAAGYERPLSTHQAQMYTINEHQQQLQQQQQQQQHAYAVSGYDMSPIHAFQQPQPQPTPQAYSALPRLETNSFDWSDASRNTSIDYSAQPTPKDFPSSTPSLCGDGVRAREVEVLPSPVSQSSEGHSNKTMKRSRSSSPRQGQMMKVEDTMSPSTTISKTEIEVPAKPAPPAPRKRGRPRLNHADTDPNALCPAGKPRSKCTRRLPHNQVERKYRESLNAELDRLRRAVPTLPQHDNSTEVGGPPKPSKATVLASAIEYIKAIESDREKLIEEVERLRGVPVVRSAPAVTQQGFDWELERRRSGSSDSSESFEA
jgi:hypothetical protein